MIRKLLNSFSLAFANIRSNLFHTILSALGVVIGVGALVSILSLIDGMERFAREQVATTTSLNAIVIRTEMYRKVNDILIRKDSAAVLDYLTFREICKSISNPVAGYYKYAAPGALATFENSRIGVQAFATDSVLTPDLKMKSGNFFTASSIDDKEHVALVNENFLKAAGIELTAASGKEIAFNNMKLKIVGVIESKQGGAPQLFYPISLVSTTELKSNPPELILAAEHTEQIPAIKQEIERWLKARYTNAADDFKIVTNEFRVEQIAKGFLLFRIIMGLIVGISVVVGGIGVMNVLLISVTERTSEIGIRKALGANRRDIIYLFLTESITVSAFGSLLGVAFGIAFTSVAVPVVKSLTKIPFQADYTINTIGVIAAIALLVGIVFGTYPAVRASRLDPVEAIRHE